MVLAGTLAVVFFLLTELVFLPTYGRLNRLKGSVRTKERDIIELKTLSLQYRHMGNGRSAVEKPKGESISLFSVLEKLAAESGLMEKIEYMRPGGLQLDPVREEKWVEVKLGRVTLKEFTDFLSRIQSSGGGIYIKRLSARKEGDYLSLILQPAVMEVK